MRSSSDPIVHERRRVASGRACVRTRDNDRDVREPAADVREPDVTVALDVHLPTVTDTIDAREVRDKRDTALRKSRCGEREPSRYDGSQSVRADDDRRGEFLSRSGCVQRFHAGDSAVRITNQRCDAHAFVNASTSFPCAIDEQPVENRSAQCETAIAIPTIAIGFRKPTVERRAIRSSNAHPDKLCGAGSFDPRKHLHLVEDARCLWAHVLGARLVARKVGAVEHQHVDSRARQKVRRGRSGRPAAYDDHFGAARCHRVVAFRIARRRASGGNPRITLGSQVESVTTDSIRELERSRAWGEIRDADRLRQSFPARIYALRIGEPRREVAGH